MFYNHDILSQTSPSRVKVTAPVVNRQPENYSDQVTVIDPVSGSAFENNMDIRNSPYFIESWQNSLIKLNDGRVLEGIKTRFNINNFSVHFTTDEKVQMFFPPELVKELDIYEKTETKNIMYKFKTGFPKVDNLDQNSFYQVLSEGTISLLKSIRKNLVVNKNDISGEVEKQFIFYENYYLFSNNKMIRLKKDKDFILKLVSAKKDKIEEFMKDHPTNFKNIADLVSLVNFYNAL